MFSTELGYTLEAAFREASQRGHAYFCLEHLLYALLFDEQIVDIVRNCGGKISDLRKDLESYFDEKIEKVESKLSGSEEGTPEVAEPIQTQAIQRVLQRAILHMHSAGKTVITAREVFVALFTEQESHAVYFLNKQGVERADVMNYVAHGISKLPPSEDDADESRADRDDYDGDEFDGDSADTERTSAGRGNTRKRDYLSSFTENLTDQAKKGELDPIIGREAEIDRALKILSRRQKNNPLFLGDPGVGKSAMASALAQKITAGEVPDNLKGAQMFSLNVGTLVAGTKFRGEFEDRLKNLIKELSTKNGAILFIDEIHQLVGAGATGNGSMDAANLLKPALASGKLRCIGSTTHEDYKKSFEKDRALSRRFSVIDLAEPSISQTIEILKGLKGKYEEHHKVKYAPSALKAAAELSAKHINERFLPDKAIDVIDEAGAANNMLAPKKRKKTLTESEIEKVVSLIAKVPVKNVSSSDEEVLKNLEERLKGKVFGQDKAVSAVALAIKRSRANLKQDHKPMGCFLFSGPTGVGKTELAKALSKELGVTFHRFDMSEYMEKHTVARLIGAPPGYVGYEEGGILTDLIRKQPYAVLLFDEIEKAHEDIYNILLQVMDDAVLTDSHGKKADFRNVILILTTNAGSEKALSIGFGEQTSNNNREQAIKKTFKPEFRNRLDDIIHFNPLPEKVLLQIVDKFLAELKEQLRERNVAFTVSEDAKAWLGKKGFDAVLGARPMARLIQKEIKDLLADELLFGKLKTGGNVRIGLKDDKLEFVF